MKKITALFLISASLMACSNMPDRRDNSVEWRSDIKREGKIIDISFESKTSHLTKDHKTEIQTELNSFDSLKSIYARVFVDAGESDILTNIQKTRLQKIKAFMAHKGIPSSHIKFYRWKESRFDQIKENTIMITFDKNRIAPSHCPDWKSRINDKESADGTPDFGCANAYNHALLVADKNDLIEGKTLKDNDSSLKLRAVKNYQQDKTKELKAIKSSTAESGSSN